MISTSTHFNSRILELFFNHHLRAYEKCKTIISRRDVSSYLGCAMAEPVIHIMTNFPVFAHFKSSPQEMHLSIRTIIFIIENTRSPIQFRFSISLARVVVSELLVAGVFHSSIRT